MSVWTQASGTIRTHLDDHLSIKKCFNEFFKDRDAIINCEWEYLKNHIKTNVEINLREEGVIGACLIQSWLDFLCSKSNPDTFEADIDVSIRILK